MPNATHEITDPAAKLADAQLLAVDAGPGGLLALRTEEGAYLDRLTKLLSPYGAAYVQSCDEDKRPPLEVLRQVVQEGLFVTGVPLPPVKELQAAIAKPELAAALGADRIAALQAVCGRAAEIGPQREILDRMAECGQARMMALSSIEMAKLSGVGIGTFLGVSSGLSAQSLSKIGTPEQQALWLNALQEGVFTYAFGLTEAAAGSDPRSMRTSFRKVANPDGTVEYVLSGDKKFIGNAACVKDESGSVIHRGADYLLIYAVDDPAKPPAERSFRLFMVPREAIGEENIAHSGGDHNKLGLREVNNGDFKLNAVRVPEACTIGRPGEDIYPKLLGLLDITRLFVGAMGLGTADAALGAAKRYSESRQQNGHAIEEFQLVSFPLRDLEARALAGKLLILDAAERVDRAAREKAGLAAQSVSWRAGFDAAIARLDGPAGRLSEEQRASLAQAASEARAAMESIGATSKLRDGTKRIEGAVKEISALTLSMRNAIPAGAEQASVKACYKGLQALLETISGASEPVRFGKETAMAKLYNTELAEESIKQAINTLGGNGFMEHPDRGLGLAKRLRDSKVLTIYEGTSNIQRNIISQGVLLEELKSIKSDMREGLRHWLLSCESTKRICYGILKSTSHTTLARAQAAFKYAVADVISRYGDALKAVETKWKQSGVPAEYAGWDQKSLERQQNLLASLPVQARMGLLADIATEHKLLKLASAELKHLGAKPALTPEETKAKETLGHFETIALERIVELGRKLGSKSLREREDAYIKRWATGA